MIVTLEVSLRKPRDTSCICMNFLKNDVYSVNASSGPEEKIRVLPIGVEPHQSRCSTTELQETRGS